MNLSEPSFSVPASTRLSYRLMDAEQDQELLFEIDQDPEVMRFLNNGKPTTWHEITTIFVPRLSAYTNPLKGWGIYAVFEYSSGDYIGWVLVRPMDYFCQQPDFDNLELGWRFKRYVWGKGYATEASKHLMIELHKQFGYQQFSAVAERENSASINVMKRLGMHFVSAGIHKDPTVGGMLVDTYSCDISSIE